MSDVPLREHFQAQLSALKEGVEKAEQQLRVRLDGMNEFREALRDQAARMATREEVKLMLDSLVVRLNLLELEKARASGRALLWSGVLSTTVLLLIAVIVYIIKA